MSLGSNGVNRVRSLRKILKRLRGTNFCTSSARFARSFVTQPNGHKCTKILYKPHKNMSSGSNAVDWVHWLRKIPTRLHGTNFCTSSAHFAPSFVSQPNSPKCTKIVRTHQNMSLGSIGVDRVHSLQKILTQLRGTNFSTSSARFGPSFKSQPNGPKCTKIVRTHQNMSLGSNGVDRVLWLQKIPTRLRGMNFCTSSARFASSFVTQPNGRNAPKLYEMHQNISLGSNRIYRVRSFRKITMRLRATNFCTSSARFAPSFISQPNGP